MNDTDLALANKLSIEIKQISRYIKVLEWASSTEFKQRDACLNILGTDQEEGETTIPASIMKKVCLESIDEWKHILEKKKLQFKNL